MFLAVKQLEVGKVCFHETFAPGTLGLEETLRQVTPLEAEGTAELLASTQEIRVRGRLRVRIETDCDRCLEQIGFSIDDQFELLYQPAAAGVGGELEILAGEAEVGFYDGDGLELADVLREQILLSLPMQRTCREDCKGICPFCGQDRNQADCACRPALADDRWAGLRNL